MDTWGDGALEPALVELVQQARADAEVATAHWFTAMYSSGMALVDEHGTVVDLNETLADLVHLPREQLLGRSLVEFGATVADRDLLRTELDGARSAGVAARARPVSFGVDDAAAVRTRVSLLRLGARTAESAAVLCVVGIVDELHRLRRQAGHDPLTGLPNATKFAAHVETALDRDNRAELALIHLDLDGFKAVRNALGKVISERVLRVVAERIRISFDGYEPYIARLSDNGFGVCLHATTSTHGVVSLVERGLTELAEPMDIGGTEMRVSASAGIVSRPSNGSRQEDVQRDAEIALHHAKAAGKSQWALSHPYTTATERHRYQLAAAMAHALETGEFGIVYNPHVVLPDANIVTSLNASLCWNHPDQGRLDTREFYPVADMIGMTVSLGRWLLDRGLETAADWLRRFAEDAPQVCMYLPHRLAVDPDLVHIVRDALDRYELTPSALQLCIDSPAILDQDGDLLDAMKVLAELGMTFIADVGGTADLELIADLQVPAPGAMLTGRVVHALAGDVPPEHAKRHVSHLVERATELGIVLGAHQVRNRAHAERLYDLGVLVAGGPFLTRSLTRADAEVWVGRNWHG